MATSWITATLAPTGTIQTWNYDYQYKIPGTSFTAEQSARPGQQRPVDPAVTWPGVRS